MALTEIQYGSIASSATMNNNFNYLDGRITQINETIMTNISSIVSNIATINSRLTELASDLTDAESELNTKIEAYRAKSKLLVAKNSLLPNWTSCTSVNVPLSDSYTAPSNGYLVLAPAAGSSGNITINNKVLNCTANVIAIPVAQGDVFSASITLSALYFIPLKEVSIEGF